MNNISSYIDHTILKPNATFAEIDNLCNEALQYKFASVCVAPFFIKKAKSNLATQNSVKIATVIGFPHGNQTINAKINEMKDCISFGADELDIVVSLNAMANEDFDFLENEIKNIVDNKEGKTIKLILESGLWNDEILIKTTKLYSNFDIEYLKTSTGFFEKGASLHAIDIFNKYKNAHQKIKASGGIRDFETTIKYIDKGVSRIGTSSGILIVNH